MKCTHNLMRFDNDYLRELKLRNPLVSIVEQDIALTNTGKSCRGSCPFHEETSASFTINLEDDYYYCFGCHATGDVFKYLMERRGFTFVQAVNYLDSNPLIVSQTLSTVNKSMSSVNKPQRNTNADDRKKLNDVFLQACEFFQSNLKGYKKGMDYLRGRLVIPEIIFKFGIGYATSDWDAILDLYDPKEFKLLHSIGLLGYSNKRQKYYSAFRNRVMLPFLAESTVIGFNGRSLDPNESIKYLLTKNTVAFSRSEYLYGEIKKGLPLYLVEGNFDVLTLLSLGHCAVCPQGSAVKPVMLNQILRARPSAIVLGFDNDFAGSNCQTSTLNLLANTNIPLYRIDFPEGIKDPSELLTRVSKDISSFVFPLQQTEDIPNLLAYNRMKLNLLIQAIRDKEVQLTPEVLESMEYYKHKINSLYQEELKQKGNQH